MIPVAVEVVVIVVDRKVGYPFFGGTLLLTLSTVWFMSCKHEDSRDGGGGGGGGGPRWNTARYRYYRSTRHSDRKCNSQEDKERYPDTANNTPQSISGNDHPYTAPRNHSTLPVFWNTRSPSPTPAHSTIPQQAAHNRDLLNNASPSTSAVNVCIVTAEGPSPFLI